MTAANQVGGEKGPNSQLGISAYTQISLHLKSFFDLEPPSPTPFSQDHIPQHHLSSRNLSRVARNVKGLILVIHLDLHTQRGGWTVRISTATMMTSRMRRRL